MLSDMEKHEIERELSHCPNRHAGSIEALKIVQRHRGWVSDEAIRDISGFLGMTPDELEGVATFYNLIFRKPVGRHVILLCDGVVCWMMGEVDLRDHLYRRLGIGPGQTTEDNRFTLLPNSCLGVCDRGPAMMIDERTYMNLTVESIDAILDQYR